MTELPSFRYHPDPLATGSIAASDAECESCGQFRGYIYKGPVFAVDEIESLCPWCIADGSANERFDAEFTDVEPLPDGIQPEIVEEICCRTPGFSGWQQERWLFHCGDGAAYLGRADWADIEGNTDAIASILADGWREESLPHISKDGDLVGYLFGCLHCGAKLAYVDAS